MKIRHNTYLILILSAFIVLVLVLGQLWLLRCFIPQRAENEQNVQSEPEIKYEILLETTEPIESDLDAVINYYFDAYGISEPEREEILRFGE